jgi:uncharacterized protein YjbJ (UPF0337 family)
MNRLTLKGSWNETKGSLKKKYAQLTDDDLLYEEGHENVLIGRLQKKLGESEERVREIISKA